MPRSVFLRCCLVAMLVQLACAILTQYRGDQREAAGANQRAYKYLRGYYQNDESGQAPPARRRYARERSPAPAENASGRSAAEGRTHGTTYIEPKSGLRSGRYRYAQSPDYVRKLKRLAALLKARAAARTRRKPTARSYPAPPAQPPGGYRRPPAQRSAPQQFVPQPVRQQYAPAPAPQPAYGLPPPAPAPQPAYGVPPPAPAPQPGYGQVNRNPSSQSLGLPRGGAYQGVRQSYLPAPVTTPRPSPKVNTQALVRLLKASYASLMPLLLNQVKMTSYGVQSIPLYGSNPYSVFGPMTYGPLPKPNLSQMSLSYNPQSFSSGQARPSPRPVSGYSSNGAVAPPQTGYSSGVSTSYGTGSQRSVSYGSSQSFDISADESCGPISEMFCHGRTSGLYSHPASGQCFVQCDHVGRGVARSCSPGTFWKALGPEPALFNYCS